MYWYDRWLRTAVHAWLLQITGSPVWTGFGSDRLLNFTTKIFVSMLSPSLSVVCLLASKESAWEYWCHKTRILKYQTFQINVPDLGLDLFHGHCTLWVFFFGCGLSHCSWFFRIPLGLGEPRSVTTSVRKYIQSVFVKKAVTDLSNQSLNGFSIPCFFCAAQTSA